MDVLTRKKPPRRFARTAGAIEGFSGIPNSSLLQDDKFVIENRRLNVNGDEDFAAHANCGVPLQVLASRAEDDAKKIAVGRRFVWSGRPDLNRRPHAPQALKQQFQGYRSIALSVYKTTVRQGFELALECH